MPDYLSAMPMADFLFLHGEPALDTLPSEAIIEWGGSHYVLPAFIPSED